MSSELHSVVQMHGIQNTAVSLTGLQIKMRIKLRCPGRDCGSGRACCYENLKSKGTKKKITVSCILCKGVKYFNSDILGRNISQGELQF